MFGILYENWKTYADGHDPSILALKANIYQLNPSVSQAWLDKQRDMDPEKFEREYMSEWQIGLAAFVDRDTIFNLVIPGRKELAPVQGRMYFCFVDPNGGAGQDEYAMAIAHTVEASDGTTKIIIDCVRGVRNGRPADITAEFAAIMKSYGISECVGDAYSGDWCSDEFSRNGIQYSKSEQNKSQLYLEALPALRQGRVELLDDRIANLQFCPLERNTSKVGKDIVSHPTVAGARDDRSNCIAGAITLCSLDSNVHVRYWQHLGTPEGRAQSQQQILEQQLRRVNYPTQIHY
jgi:hypothetical protein